jgi:hypothetical protein
MTSFLHRTLLLLALLLSAVPASAQWTPTDGPIADAPPFTDLEFFGNEIWGTNGAIYSMPVDADRWTMRAPRNGFTSNIEPAGDLLLAIQGNNLMRYLPDGRRSLTSMGLGPTGALEWLDAGLMIGSYYGIYVSSDSGRTWRSIDEGLEGLERSGLAFHRGMIFTGVSSLEPLGNPEQKGVWRRSVARPVSHVREVAPSARQRFATAFCVPSTSQRCRYHRRDLWTARGCVLRDGRVIGGVVDMIHDRGMIVELADRLYS